MLTFILAFHVSTLSIAEIKAGVAVGWVMLWEPPKAGRRPCERKRQGSPAGLSCPPEISLHEGHLALVGEPEQWFNSIAGYSQPHHAQGKTHTTVSRKLCACVMEAGRGGRVLDAESWAGDKNGSSNDTQKGPKGARKLLVEVRAGNRHGKRI